MDDALCWVSSATASAEWLGSRPGRDTLGVQVLNAIGTYAVAPAFGLKSSPVLSIVCIITASLRAPPLDLEVFISSNAFYNSPFFYEQPEFARSVFVLNADIIGSRREVDTTSGEPIMLHNTLVRCFLSLCDLIKIDVYQTGRDG